LINPYRKTQEEKNLNETSQTKIFPLNTLVYETKKYKSYEKNVTQNHVSEIR